MSVFKKFFVTDTCSDYFWGKVVDATASIDFLLKLDGLFIEKSRRGLPWKCLLARGIVAASEADRSLFGFTVRYAYTDGSLVYVFSNVSRRRTPTAICFRHNFTKTLRQFDQITKAQFIELFGATGVDIRLRPPVRRRHDEERAPSRPQPSRRPSEHEAGERRIVGARKRALDAGLLDRIELNGERPTA